jgi:hypothetical protein
MRHADIGTTLNVSAMSLRMSYVRLTKKVGGLAVAGTKLQESL